MKIWIDLKIEEWRHWNKDLRNVSIIPPQIQVGKMLEYCNGDINEARKLIKYEQSQDTLMGSFSGDPYWINVEMILLENIVHDLIIGD